MKNKKWLYILLFVWIMMIDWLYATQNGYYKAVMGNSLGVMMGVLTLQHYPYVKEKYKKSDLCWLALWMVGSIIGWLIWVRVKGPINIMQYVMASVAVGILGLTVIRVLLTRFWKRISWKKNGLTAVLFTIMSLWMVLSRYYEIWQVWFLGMFLCFYLTKIHEEEERVMWDSLSIGVIAAFFGIQIWAYGFRPFDEVRYLGPYSNQNMAALFYLIVYTMVLYRIHVLHYKEKNGLASSKKWVNIFFKVFYYVLAGGLVSFIFFTICRTALLVLLGLTFLFGLISNLWLLREKLYRLILRWAALILCAVITFPCVYGTIRYLPCILHHPVWFEGEYKIEKVHSFDSWDSWKYVSLEDFLEVAVKRMSGGVLDWPVASPDDDLLYGEDVNDSGKIRMAIWKKYLSNLNMTGHTIQESHYQITEEYHAWHAQNIFIQMLYIYGIPAGIMFVLLMIWYGVKSLGLLVDAKEPTVVLPGMIFVVFMGFGMLECVWYAGQAILILMYLAARRLLIKVEK